MFRPASGRLIAGSSRHRMNSEISPIGMLMKKIQCQPNVSVMNPPMAGPDERRQAEHGAEQAEVLAALGRRVEVGDHRERDREDGAAAEALEAAEQDELPHLLAEAGAATELIRNRLTAKMTIGRRPKRSDSLP